MEQLQEKFSRVKMHSILSIVSSNPIGPGQVHKLSILDQSMGLHRLHIVFYYKSNPFDNGPMNSDIDNLRASLSHTLNEYPIVTGRLARGPDGSWQVRCNDAGVRMLQASVGATMDEWLRSADVVEERDLTVWEDMPEDPSFWSPFRIQINNFTCGGLAIGLSCTHMHADITSATHLIKSWTQVHRTLPLTHSPIFDLPNPPTPSLNISSPSLTSPSKMATATMKFTHSSIQKCLSQIQNHSPNATPFDVLVALLWSRIALWEEQKPDDNHKHSLSICVDSRNHGHPPIPYNYFGNALHFSVLDVDSDALMSGGLGQVCEYVHQHVEGLKRDELRLEVEGEEGRFRVYGPQLTCINTEHMVDGENGEGLMYSAVFDKGEKPVHVSYHVENVVGEGLIMVLPSSEGGLGRLVTIILPEERIAKVCKDQVILDLGPTMVISGRR